LNAECFVAIRQQSVTSAREADDAGGFDETLLAVEEALMNKALWQWAPKLMFQYVPRRPTDKG